MCCARASHFLYLCTTYVVFGCNMNNNLSATAPRSSDRLDRTAQQHKDNNQTVHPANNNNIRRDNEEPSSLFNSNTILETPSPSSLSPLSKGNLNSFFSSYSSAFSSANPSLDQLYDTDPSSACKLRRSANCCWCSLDLKSVFFSDSTYTLPSMIALTGDPLQDDLLQLCRETGIEDIAKEAGVIRNGEIPALKEYSGTSSF